VSQIEEKQKHKEGKSMNFFLCFRAGNENENLTVGIEFIKNTWALCQLKRECALFYLQTEFSSLVL